MLRWNKNPTNASCNFIILAGGERTKITNWIFAKIWIANENGSAYSDLIETVSCGRASIPNGVCYCPAIHTELIINVIMYALFMLRMHICDGRRFIETAIIPWKLHERIHHLHVRNTRKFECPAIPLEFVNCWSAVAKICAESRPKTNFARGWRWKIANMNARRGPGFITILTTQNTNNGMARMLNHMCKWEMHKYTDRIVRISLCVCFKISPAARARANLMFSHFYLSCS